MTTHSPSDNPHGTNASPHPRRAQPGARIGDTWRSQTDMSKRACCILAGFFGLATLGTGCMSKSAKRQELYNQGVRAFDQQKYSEAVLLFGRALQVDPSFADAHYKLAQSQERQGNWLPAMQELQRTLDLQPGNQQARIDLGRIYLAGRKGQEAKDHASTVLQSDPKNVDALILASDADALLGDLKKALQEAQAATAAAPSDRKAFLNLATIQERDGADAKAEETLKNAQSIDPSSVPTLLALGNLYAHQQRYPDAIVQ